MKDFEWIDAGGRFRLAIQHRPRGGLGLRQDLSALAERGVAVIVSMQPELEAAQMGLADEGLVAAQLGLELRRFAVRDHDVPSDPAAALAFADELLHALEQGRGVLIHCYAGIGRSGLMAALVMVRAGFGMDDACMRISLARGIPVPETLAQRRWLDDALRLGSP